MARAPSPSPSTSSFALIRWRNSLARYKAGVEKRSCVPCREEKTMRTRRLLYLVMLAVAVAMLFTMHPVRRSGQQNAPVRIDAGDIGGVVTSANGPEAGVWVIAETTELPTKFAKIVVTDDQGRYVIPDLPKANYSIWVRGYGLVDSPKVKTAPGKILNLKAVVAPDERAAAQYYPAIYWYAMMKIPPGKDFGGSTDIPKNITRETWRQRMGNVDCIG